ncbi:MAG: hypothetical protein IPK03_03470 [Bacteroidetes bacterium]|nr:hypothetical protein [Bacteroidota bacterium]
MNIDKIIVYLFGYASLFCLPIVNSIFYTHLPPLIFISIYFMVFSILSNCKKYAGVVAISFVFISTYLYLTNLNSIQITSFKNIYNILTVSNNAGLTYTYILLPFGYLSASLNFYQLNLEVSSIFPNNSLKKIIPILAKRELIFERFNMIVFAFNSRGIETRGFITSLLILKKILVPLIITTLFEGVESYDYNKMLNTNIEQFKPNFYKMKIKVYQTILMIIFALLLTVITYVRCKLKIVLLY